MNIQNYIGYGMCIYDQHTTRKDDHKLGDVVIKKEDNEIGVVIQVHEPSEFRCDMFGNFSSSEVRMATDEEIALYRPNILNEGTFNHSLK